MADQRKVPECNFKNTTCLNTHQHQSCMLSSSLHHSYDQQHFRKLFAILGICPMMEIYVSHDHSLKTLLIAPITEPNTCSPVRIKNIRHGVEYVTPIVLYCV